MTLEHDPINPWRMDEEDQRLLAMLGATNDNEVVPLLVTVRQAQKLLGVGKTSIFLMLSVGVLERSKPLPGMTRITWRSVRKLAGV